MHLYDYERKWYGLFSDNRIWKESRIKIFNEVAKGARERSGNGDVEDVRTYCYENMMGVKIKQNNQFIFGYDV